MPDKIIRLIGIEAKRKYHGRPCRHTPNGIASCNVPLGFDCREDIDCEIVTGIKHDKRGVNEKQ